MVDIARERAARLAALPLERIGGSYQSFLKGTRHAVRDLLGHRELLGLLVRRELKARYKDSALGFLWTLIRPIVMLLIYYFAIGYFLGAQRQIPMFAIFVFAGLTLWGLWSEVLTAGTMSILTNAGLIKKVYVPRELFPLAAVGSALVNFGIQMIVLIGAMVVFGQFVFTWDLLYLLPGTLVILVLATAFSLLLSALNVYLRDVQYLVEVSVLMLFWASPIVYSYQMVHEALKGNWIEQLYLANPITVSILAFQKAAWLPGPSVQTQLSEDMGIDPATFMPADLDLRLAIMGIVSLLFLWFSHRVFLRLQGNFAQEI
ncbi:ABC transporter permease [Homoserinibacter sp. YIM 151385]|uniref:ABC transporter permease n=1 Tax=Homoserinibacter sp. YIM 151385 TaxID=2985506 RepID=UPI0022F0540B|nr:ABC transporter permease [Homoserinibacter sp. YIM 151385]WBU37785.1 ABC transporter permease [Homoserinibacter sp. YIM 151385]